MLSWGSPERSWAPLGYLLEVLGDILKRLGMIFLSPGDVESEASEKFGFDDRLNGNGRFLKSQGLRNEAKIILKQAEKRKRGREDATREQRSGKSALESVLGALWGDVLRFRGSLGEGRWNARRVFPYLTDPAFRRLRALKVRKSVLR